MPLIPKEILRPGKYYTQTKDKDGKPVQSVLHVTQEDLHHLHEVGNLMVRDHGLQVPCCMEHQDGAAPQTEEERKLQLSQKRAHSVEFNKGWVGGYYLERDKGSPKSLWALLDIPDEDFASRLPHEVRFASPEIRPSYTSGDCTTYRDVITHIALTPRPVWSGQKPFGELPEDFNNGPLPGGGVAHPLKERLMQGAGVCLSLNDFISDTPVQLSKDPSPMAEEKKEMPAAESKGGGSNDYKECLGLLKDHGIELHENTPEEDFIPHLTVLLRGLKGVLAPMKEEEPEKKEDEAKPDMGMDEGAGKVEELPASVTMSNAQDEEIKLLKDELSATKLASLNSKIDAWTKEGFVAPARSQSWKKGLETHRLSLAGKEPDKEVARIMAQMEVVEQDYAKKGLFTGGAQAVKLSQTEEVSAPLWSADTSVSDPAEIEKIVSEFAKNTKLSSK